MKEKKYGFIDKTGRFVIEPKYDDAGVFSEGLAYVKIGENHYYINKSGRIVIELDDECINGGNSFHEGLATVKGYNKMGIIDKSGRRIGLWIGGYISGFHEGLALVKKGYGLNICGFIDKNGQSVIEPQFKVASPFSEGLAMASFDSLYHGRFGFIDKTGRFVIQPKYKSFPSVFSESLAAVVIGTGDEPDPNNDRGGFIDKTGNFVIEPKYRLVYNFHEGLAKVSTGKNQGGFIDKKGQMVFTTDQFKFVGYHFQEGLAIVRLDDKWGYIDKTGKIAIDPRFNEAWEFSEGMAQVKLEDKYGFIDKTGQLVMEPQFESVYDFHEGLACVEVEREVCQTSVVNNYQSTQKPQPRPTSSSTKQNTSSGCYIATAVYGSYDCPQLWTLRRYRDNVLDKSWYGRLFIQCYYAVSPTLVKWFGQASWFRNMFRKPLSKWVAKLNKHGFEDIPYKDKY